MEGTEFICRHRVSWMYSDSHDILLPKEFPESEREHVEKLICEGYHSGELCYNHYDEATDEEYEFRGWWSIVS